jgi:hypothetical protein
LKRRAVAAMSVDAISDQAAASFRAALMDGQVYGAGHIERWTFRALSLLRGTLGTNLFTVGSNF